MAQTDSESPARPKARRPAAILVGIAAVVALAAAALFLLPVLRDGEGPDQPQQTRVGIATWPGFAPVFLAQNRGYFEGVNVSVDVLDDFTARQAAFVSQQHDFTIYTIDSLAFDAGKGVRGAIVLILDRSNGSDGIVVRHGIDQVADLRGMRVAYTRGSPAHFLLVNVLRGAGLTIRDIRTVEVDDPTRAAEAFLAGSVDAAVTWEPYLGQITRQERGRVLVSSRTLDRIVDVLVASPRVIRDRPEIVQAVVSGWMRALDELGQPRQDTYRIMAAGLGLPEAEFQTNSEGVLFGNRQMNQDWLNSPPGQATRAHQLFREAAAIWREEGLSESPESSGPFVDNRFVIEELRRAGGE